MYEKLDNNSFVSDKIGLYYGAQFERELYSIKHCKLLFLMKLKLIKNNDRTKKYYSIRNKS
jgi:hypothetical protein